MMKTIYIKNENDIEQSKETVLVLGYFDGLHKGHQALFKEARKRSKKQGLEVVVLTFPETPKLTFARFQPDLLLHLNSLKEREEKFAELGVDRLYLMDFTTRLSTMTAREFVERFIQRLKAKTIIAGFDYHFGSDQRQAQDLEKYFSGEVNIIPSVDFKDEKISSTRIRKAIQTGEVLQAHRLLGYPFSTEGIVVHGDARGRTIGYPTANLAPLERVMLPADGVYVVEVGYDKKRYRGMASVGKNETFDGKELRFEVHLFEFSKEIYGDRIRIYWLDRIRDMSKFESEDQLIQQLKKDKKIAETWSDK